MVDPSSRTQAVTVELPAELGELDGDELRALPARTRLLLLVDQVRCRKLGANQAACAAGLELLDFYAVLAEHKVPTHDLDPGALAGELASLESISTAS